MIKIINIIMPLAIFSQNCISCMHENPLRDSQSLSPQFQQAITTTKSINIPIFGKPELHYKTRQKIEEALNLAHTNEQLEKIHKIINKLDEDYPDTKTETGIWLDEIILKLDHLQKNPDYLELQKFKRNNAKEIFNEIMNDL